MVTLEQRQQICLEKCQIIFRFTAIIYPQPKRQNFVPGFHRDVEAEDDDNDDDDNDDADAAASILLRLNRKKKVLASKCLEKNLYALMEVTVTPFSELFSDKDLITTIPPTPT